MPNYYAQIDQEGRVFSLNELAGEVNSTDLIPISQELYNNMNLLRTRYVNGEFVGLTAELTSDKACIAADGSDCLTIQVRVTDWQGQPQTSYNDEVMIDVNGMQQAIKLSKGLATFTLSSEEPGEFMVRTLKLDRNTELKVVVSDGI